MPKYILLAPDYDKRNLPDFNKNFSVPTYSEHVFVRNGVAECNTVTARDTLIGLGYKLVGQKDETPPEEKREKASAPKAAPKMHARRVKRRRKRLVKRSRR